MPRQIVLIGAGHTHLHVVEQWRKAPIDGAELTLVSPYDRATYSGMLPGTLAGQYGPDEMSIDLKALLGDSSSSAGMRLVLQAAVGLDPVARRVRLADGSAISFDVASVGIGSVPAHPPEWTAHPEVVPIKPMSTFLSRLDARMTSSAVPDVEPGVASPVRIAVIGGGAGGFEVACCLDERLKKRGLVRRLTLIDANSEILSNYSRGARSRACRHLAKRGIDVKSGWRVAAIERAGGWADLVLDGGERITVDAAIIATRAASPPELTGFDLPTCERGFLTVRDTLQTTSGHPVFAVGDTAGFVSRPVPKAGVYAVREGPILWRNVRNLLEGRPLIEYRPQRTFLSLLNTGDGRAIAEYHGVAVHARWAWWLKDRIDRRFMGRFKVGGG